MLCVGPLVVSRRGSDQRAELVRVMTQVYRCWRHAWGHRAFSWRGTSWGPGNDIKKLSQTEEIKEIILVHY